MQGESFEFVLPKIANLRWYIPDLIISHVQSLKVLEVTKISRYFK